MARVVGLGLCLGFCKLCSRGRMILRLKRCCGKRFMCALPGDIRDNPLLDQQGLPRFNAIGPDHVVPGITFLVEECEVELKKLEHSLEGETKRRTWETVVEALELLGSRLSYGWGVVNHLNGVQNSDKLRKAFQTVQPEVVKVSSLVAQSQPVYKAMKELETNNGGLDGPQLRIISSAVRSARLGGAELTGSDRLRFNKINQNLANLSNQFSNNVLDATKAFDLELSDKRDVEGLPDTLLQLMASNAAKDSANFESGPWKVTLDMPCFEPLMKHSKNRELREHVYRSYIKRASEGTHDNTQIIEDIRQLRKEKADLLGFPNFAALSLETKMASNVQNVWNLINSLKEKSRKASEMELSELQIFANENGFNGKLQLWDLAFWTERRREHLFKMNDEILRPYFPLPKVLHGLFNLTSFLFNVEILPDYESTIETWHPDVKFFNINDDAGNRIASFYLDPFSRPAEKRGGAWMDSCLEKSEILDRRPVAYLVCNQSPPVNGKTSLMTFREVETLFHEFGHGLQHMLTRVPYSSAAGINNIEWDAVELPSQFMENWVYDDQTMKAISGHYITGEALPRELFYQLIKARKYMAGTGMLRQLYLSALDIELHTSSEPWLSVLDNVAAEYSVMKPLKEDRFPCSFQHIFASGYAAGYYSYKWAEVMSADAFGAFEDVGLENRDALAKTGRRFRETVLALGGGTHPSEVFRQFRGRDPSPDALLKSYGLS
ncbi:probable cytosolic oligopeptidase A isoform X2 [Anneissia japonica]|uniref:probable cytosolic oligopeptidase A isoform X2 n=1 Tax=Anneissia japonica TaxID=1529436 RepID=UPI001425A71A|nr:probable cytosolic oligopeptidase A isoform X2 [Anneissia japonica]